MRRKQCLHSILIPFLIGTCLSAHSLEKSQNADSAIGINITAINYWSSQWMLLDIMKQGSDGSGHAWATADGVRYVFNTGEQDLLDLDENGWPRSLPDGTNPNVQFNYVTSLLIHSNEHYQPGRYIVLFEGDGEITYSGGQKNIALSTPGRDVVDLPTNSFLHLHIISTDREDTGDYIRNIRVLVPGGICDGNPYAFGLMREDCVVSFTPFEEIYNVQRFHPYFLRDLRKFRSIRFMQYFRTNSSEQSVWADRASMANVVWSTGKGGPIELTIELSNLVKAEPWLNVPARVDDDYIYQYAQLTKSLLDPELDLYLELGNEVWNSSYPYILDANWMEQRARALWPNASVSGFGYRLNYYGLRAAQMCRIWKEVFSEDADRVKCVMGAQAGNAWVGQQSLACPLFASTEGGYPCARDMYALAIGPYFGGYLNQDRYLTLWSEWLTEPDQALSRLFDEINNGILRELAYDPNLPDWRQAPEGGSLAATERFMQRNADVARQFNIALTAYEGGQHLTFAGNMAGVRQQVNEEVFMAGNRDPRMGEAFSTHLNDWKTAGGEVYMVFESTGQWGRFGSFPLKEYQSQPTSDAPKFAAVLDFISESPCWWGSCERNIFDNFPDVDEGGDSGSGSGSGADNSGSDNSGGDEGSEEGTDGVDESGGGANTNVSIHLLLTPTPDSQGIRLDWQENIDSASIYKIYRNGITITHRTAGTQQFSNDWLRLGFEYSYYIEVYNDQRELLHTSETISSLAGDSYAPTTPENFTVVSDGGWGFVLNWDASTDNTGVAFYRIYRNGQQYTHRSGTTFHDPWPPAGDVTYQIIAHDNYHNASEATIVVIGKRE